MVKQFLTRLNLRHNWPLVVACCALTLTIVCVSASCVFTPYFAFVIYPLLYAIDLLPAIISLVIIILITFILALHGKPDGSKKGCLYSIFTFVGISGLLILRPYLPLTEQDMTSFTGVLSFLVIVICVFYLMSIFSRKDNRIIKRTIIVLFGALGFSICTGTLLLFTSKNIDHISSIYKESKTYQLAAIIDIEASCRWVDYVLYTCDASGKLCEQGQQINEDFLCRPRDFPPIDAKLVSDGENLYLQIGDQKTLIAQ